jgi:hypothetical protein
MADGAAALLYHEWLMVLQPYFTMVTGGSTALLYHEWLMVQQPYFTMNG